MQKYAIIVAGGWAKDGRRHTKQFLLLQQSLYSGLLQSFLNSFDDIHVIRFAKSNMAEGKDICKQLAAKISTITEGVTFHSVQNGLQFVTEPSIIFVHDGVRCLITKELFEVL